MKTCNCGSGKSRFELVDAAGIFCNFVCEDCYLQVKATYNPAIFRGRSRYARSGVEEDIFADDY